MDTIVKYVTRKGNDPLFACRTVLRNGNPKNLRSFKSVILSLLWCLTKTKFSTRFYPILFYSIQFCSVLFYWLLWSHLINHFESYWSDRNFTSFFWCLKNDASAWGIVLLDFYFLLQVIMKFRRNFNGNIYFGHLSIHIDRFYYCI